VKACFLRLCFTILMCVKTRFSMGVFCVFVFSYFLKKSAYVSLLISIFTTGLF